MNWRLYGHGALICLPALGLCAFGAYFLNSQVPKIVSAEKSAVTREYRRVAEALAANPESATFHGQRRKGWRMSGRISRKGADPVLWGHVTLDGRELVWVGAGDGIAGRYTATICPFDFGSLFGVGVPAVLALVVALTALCLRFFVAYAKERDDFVAATAHDLATPLVAMRRLIGRDDAEAKSLADRMVRIVENLSEFLELGGRRPQPKLEPVDLVDAYREAYALFRDDFRFHFGGHDVEVSGLERLVAAADRTCAVQMLWNLLANELKYAAPYGRVSVRFETGDDRARVVFSDEGPGLSRRERRRIFRRYYRAKSLMKCGKGGFGIGLCTARDGARAMGGDLTVAANAPHGCVFTLELRRAT